MSTSARSLVLGENFSLKPSPLTPPDAKSPTILIIGGGVIGLTTAWVLLDRGYHVTILAKEWATFTSEQRMTSQIAGALWEWPPSVCGQRTDPISLSHSKTWCMVAYRIWGAIASDPELAALAGVRMRASNFCFPFPIDDDQTQRNKMHEIMQSGIKDFRRTIDIVEEYGINPEFGAVDAYGHLAPVIDTDQCMGWLMTMTRSKGAKFHTETIHGDLYPQEKALLDRFSAKAIINCTGLEAFTLANDDTCYPLRGALIRVINDGTDFSKIEATLAIAADVAYENEVYIVPRNDNILVIGGLAQAHIGELGLTLDSPEIKHMRARANSFLPKLKHARVDPEYPLSQSLRPNREKNIRVERELRQRTVVRDGKQVKEPSKVIHSYGHGGAGWSLCFGCAADVAQLAEETLRSLPAQRMQIQERARL